MKVRARLANPLPKTQAVKGGMRGGFRIGHAGMGGFSRFGKYIHLRCLCFFVYCTPLQSSLLFFQQVEDLAGGGFLLPEEGSKVPEGSTFVDTVEVEDFPFSLKATWTTPISGSAAGSHLEREVQLYLDLETSVLMNDLF